MDDEAGDGETRPSRPARRGGVSVAALAAATGAPSADAKRGQRGSMGGEFQSMILRLREGGIGGASSDGEMERSIIQVRTLCTSRPRSRRARQGDPGLGRAPGQAKG